MAESAQIAAQQERPERQNQSGRTTSIFFVFDFFLCIILLKKYLL
jgi:hypothetical protein